ncbi:ABC-type multidrug transport system fused ATPase/permease subunit [Paenibacillus endophyticus]|uniref:ABC-type multidrug transport system fused ATPase/permease subunit n=1 Tax=Paenibacillus endophyticus TaxID=1294268 RepID=A0A7W5C551_9BACL|nr:hypothetical protein [Paenibacillus endophyticus]MBB3150960.1 ABC-type multidrug transport system fused ATPase/permease subunit [Paenibacillus endophyticus]
MMRSSIWKILVFACLISVIHITAPQPAVHAGFFDRIKDIYNTPEKISELEQQYIEAKEELAAQQQKLVESAKAAEEYALKQQTLLEQNEQFRQQNEQLIAQNADMQAEMARMKQERQSFVSKLIYTVVILAAVFAAYIISIRIWRYLVWRKQRGTRGRGISG